MHIVPICITTHFSTLHSICQSIAHLAKFFKSSLSNCTSSSVAIARPIFVPSANLHIFENKSVSINHVGAWLHSHVGAFGSDLVGVKVTGMGVEVYNKSNSTAGAVQVKANLQEELSIHFHFRKLNIAKNAM